MVECRGSRVIGRGSRVIGRGSRSRVESRGSKVEGRKSKFKSRKWEILIFITGNTFLEYYIFGICCQNFKGSPDN
jgi:hypothetical protein